MIKAKLLVYPLLILLFIVPSVLADFDFYRKVGAGTPVQISYEGATGSVDTSVVKNNAVACDISCTYYTNQDPTERNVPSVVGGLIPNGMESPQFSISAKAIGQYGSGTLTTTVTCVSTGGFLCGSEPRSHSKDVTLQFPYCGDANTDAGHETCDDGSKSCSVIDSKYHPSKSASCKSDCSGYDTSSCEFCGDNKINYNEQCDSSYFGGKSCSTYGSSGGSLSCTSSCAIDNSGCYRCGDGKRNGNEACEGSDLGRATCKTEGFDYGDMKCTSGCTLDTSGCKRCENECSSAQKTCVGDGYKVCQQNPNGCWKWSEVKNCGIDAACSGGACIPLTSNENCGSIGNRCVNSFCVNKNCAECRTTDDCKGKTELEHTNNYECTADFTSRYELLTQKGGECVNYKCAGSIQKQGTVESCNGVPCQDGQCGCKEGYSEHSGKCLKLKELDLNEPCEDDFRCIFDFCYKGKCSKALSTELSAEKTTAQFGEEIDVGLSLVNELDETVKAQLILNTGSGVTISSSAGATTCPSTQCTATVDVDGRNSNAITLKVESRQSGPFLLEGEVKYDFEGKTHHIPLRKEIYFIQCGDQQCDETKGESMQNCCTDCGVPEDTKLQTYSCSGGKLKTNVKTMVWIIVASVLAFLALGYLSATKGRRFYEKATKERTKRVREEKIKKEEEENQREKIRRGLHRIRKTIDVDKPLSINTVKSKLRNLGVNSIEEDILSDEYTDFLDELEEQRKEEQKKESESEKKKEDERKQKESEKDEKEEKESKRKHCHKCGTEASGSGKFCRKCGAPLKR